MANKEALRDLQHRLAERMRSARSQPVAASWLAVECAGTAVLLPLQDAGEIFPLSALHQLPHANPWFAGVANLRGALHSVIDLAAFLGLRSETLSSERRLVALNPHLEMHCAVMVDRLLGLRHAQDLTVLQDEPGSQQSKPAFAGARLQDMGGRSWQVIDLRALARYEGFLKIVA